LIEQGIGKCSGLKAFATFAAFPIKEEKSYAAERT
jgi:hypothetical protein